MLAEEFRNIVGQSAPIICLVVAAAENGVIGRGGALPWHIPTDLKTFKRLTLGKPVIMGRRTFHSIGRPLPGRDNIVVTRDAQFTASGVTVVVSLDAAFAMATRLAEARGVAEIMVIGGADIYRQAMPRAGRLYLTRVHAQPDGDASFADPDPAAWRLVSAEALPREAKDEFACTLQVFEPVRQVAAAP